MKNKIDIFVELAERLSEGIPARIVVGACGENSWFTEEDIKLAVEAIRKQMLERQKLEEWMSRYPTLPVSKAEDILIIMAGNIPLVGFFDLLCVVMAGHRAYVKCSSKDRVLVEYVISLIKDIEPTIPIYISDCSAPDRVIATGGDSAVRHFEATYSGVKRLLRGSRHSVAVVGEGEDINKLTDDIYMYSGLGCRNVSMIFAPKGYALSLPCVNTHPQYRNNYLQNKVLTTMLGVGFVDNGASLFVRSSEFPSSLSTISVYEYKDLEEVNAWMSDNNNKIQCIVSNIIAHPRRVDFGESQRPSLYDYADAVDTMKFLM
ncbi:MAG: acyl-CoA reductase [Rikenellaceae bacterium]